MPRPKPPRISAAEAGCAVEQHQRDQDRGGAERERQEQAIITIGRARVGAAKTCRRHWQLPVANQEPRPSAFFRSSHLVREDSIGRLALLVHSTIEPA